MIATSYFANWRNFPTGIRTVAITRFPPKYYKGDVDLRLAPSEHLLSELKCGNMSPELFTKLFEKQLNKLNREEILSEYDDDVVLLCFETPDQFCHRHIVGQWLGATELP